MGTTPSIESIVLRHSGRGMDILQHYLGSEYCRHAAERLLSLRRGRVLLTTGFYVAGHAETDGPPGTMSVALALQALGFSPVIVTDDICRDLFEPEGLDVVYVPTDAGEEFFSGLLAGISPVCLISIERCGRNLQNDYANMRGVSISGETARIDTVFDLARAQGILTIGIGDGGNEIGMGNLQDVISEKLSLVPCTVPVDELIIATTSNWGAYALVAYLDFLQEKPLLLSYERIAAYLEQIVARGCVDGVTKNTVPTVDGFPQEISREILTLLHEAVDHTNVKIPA